MLNRTARSGLVRQRPVIQERPPTSQLEESTGESSQIAASRRASILNTIPVPLSGAAGRMKQSVPLQ